LRYPHDGGPDERRQRFEEVYAANRGPILGYVLRRTGNAHDAADATAETFLTAWRRLDDVPPGDQARLWLYGVARRVLANQQRGEHRRSELADRLRAELTTAYRAPEYAGELAGIAAAFRSLPEGDRELLALVGWEELDNGQAAAVLGCSRNAVRIRLHRARRRLASAIARQRALPPPASPPQPASTPRPTSARHSASAQQSASAPRSASAHVSNGGPA
jgi:RNA polymerase sigma-70 factor (ECF subfamily)